MTTVALPRLGRGGGDVALIHLLRQDEAARLPRLLFERLAAATQDGAGVRPALTGIAASAAEAGESPVLKK